MPGELPEFLQLDVCNAPIVEAHVDSAGKASTRRMRSRDRAWSAAMSWNNEGAHSIHSTINEIRGREICFERRLFTLSERDTIRDQRSGRGRADAWFGKKTFGPATAQPGIYSVAAVTSGGGNFLDAIDYFTLRLHG